MPPPDSSEANRKVGVDDFPVEVKGISMTAQTENGERLWSLSADSGDSEIKKGTSMTNLKGVAVEMFRSDKPYAKLTAENGQAEESKRTFNISGNAVAKSSDGKLSLSCDNISGSQEQGVISAKGGIQARLERLLIGPADTARALFVSKGETVTATTAMAISSLALQGENIWFKDANDTFVVYGVSQGSAKYQPDGKSVLMTLKGAPVRMEWKISGVTVIAPAVSVITAPTGPKNEYQLQGGNFAGGVTIKVKGEKSTQTLRAATAEYNGTTMQLILDGGVTVVGDGTGLGGTFAASKIITTFSRERFNSTGKYEAIKMVASGDSVSYKNEVVDKDGDKIAYAMTSLRELTVTRAPDAEDILDYTGWGSQYKFSATRTGNSPSIFSVIGNRLSGTIDTSPVYGREPTTLTDMRRREQTGGLVRAIYEGSLVATLESPIKGVAGKIDQSSLEMQCDKADYGKIPNTLLLQDVKELKGKHPMLPSGSGSLFAPIIEITFERGTFKPIAFETRGNGAGN